MYLNWDLSELLFKLAKREGNTDANQSTVECSSKVMIYIWTFIYEILMYSNQQKFFIMAANFATVVGQIIFIKHFNPSKTKRIEEDRDESNDDRLSHSPLKEEI